MKLAALLKVAAPFLATDKKPDELRRAIIAADKKAKDAAGSGLGARELEEGDKPKAQDRAAMDAREEACDSREEAMDAAEEMSDKDKAEDKAAKDRKAARDKRAADRAARALDRKAAKDRDDDPEHTNDEDLTEGADPSTPGGSRAGGKTAIDSAEIDRRITAAVAADRAAQVALFNARHEVEPVLGVVTMDSAEAVYRAALDKLGVDHKGVHASALRALVGVAKDRRSPQSATPPAMDSGASSDFTSKIPGYGRLK